MGLSNDLISQFAKITKDEKSKNNETTLYGTAVKVDDKIYAKLDGSDRLTPISTTAEVKEGERITVRIKNHSATITGNLSSPAARVDDSSELNAKVDELGNTISEFEIVVADKVSTKEFNSVKGRINTLETNDVNINNELTASKADINELKADKVTIEQEVTANKASITSLQATIADMDAASVDDLQATNARINNLEVSYGDFKDLTTTKLDANQASINQLEADKLDASTAEITYANIDFSNIGQAAIEQFYATSGIIKDLVIDNQTITGKLVGVTITGDLIEGNTVVADKLVVKGEDGLYYKLNTDGVTVEAEQTDYNSLNGSVIRAKSVTAEKISVEDLVAFDATIAGFNITESALYSGVKNSATNTTRGIYLGKDGQVAFGDSNNFIKYYKDENGNYKLAISADSMVFSTSDKSLVETLDSIQQDVNSLKDEISTLLRIESSRGTVFKKDNISTVLSVVLYHGSTRITDSETMKQVFGDSAYIQWKWQKLDDDTFGVISSDDARISNGGFTLTISPEDVNTKVTFMCELII